MGDRPPRLAGAEAELLLQREAVHFIHDTIDIERQRVPARADIAVEFDQPLGTAEGPRGCGAPYCRMSSTALAPLSPSGIVKSPLTR